MALARILLVLTAASCGRIAFDARSDATDTTQTGDDAAVPCTPFVREYPNQGVSPSGVWVGTHYLLESGAGRFVTIDDNGDQGTSPITNTKLLDAGKNYYAWTGTDIAFVDGFRRLDRLRLDGTRVARGPELHPTAGVAMVRTGPTGFEVVLAPRPVDSGELTVVRTDHDGNPIDSLATPTYQSIMPFAFDDVDGVTRSAWQSYDAVNRDVVVASPATAVTTARVYPLLSGDAYEMALAAQRDNRALLVVNGGTFLIDATGALSTTSSLTPTQFTAMAVRRRGSVPARGRGSVGDDGRRVHAGDI